MNAVRLIRSLNVDFSLFNQLPSPPKRVNKVKLSQPQTSKFLPQLPQKRNKPAWASTAPSFVLNGNPPTDLLGR